MIMEVRNNNVPLAVHSDKMRTSKLSFIIPTGPKLVHQFAIRLENQYTRCLIIHDVDQSVGIYRQTFWTCEAYRKNFLPLEFLTCSNTSVSTAFTETCKHRGKSKTPRNTLFSITSILLTCWTLSIIMCWNMDTHYVHPNGVYSLVLVKPGWIS